MKNTVLCEESSRSQESPPPKKNPSSGNITWMHGSRQCFIFATTHVLLLQPLDLGIISCVKASYTRQVFGMFWVVIDTEPNLQVMDCWKSFSIADAINFSKAAMDKVNPETANACWKNLWSEAVNDFKGVPGIDEEVNKIIQTAREVGGDGFVDMIDEVEENIKEHQKALTKEE